MSLSENDLALLLAAATCGRDRPDGFCKCDRILRSVLESAGPLSPEAETALCNSGYEHRDVGEAYNQLRALVDGGFLEGRGNLKLPAGPRYTECGITEAGREALANSLKARGAGDDDSIRR
jgi:hypothetical protein